MSNVFDKKIVNGEVALRLLQGLKTKVDSEDIQADRVKGVLDISNIPPSALPTLVVVQDDNERFKLTQDRVKKGDTVKVIKTNKLYLVTDTSQLSSSAGYTEYAQTVDWGNIEGKPGSFPPSVHSQTSDSISHMKLYVKGEDTSPISTDDSLNVAIGKLEATLGIKLNKTENGLSGEEKDVVKSMNNNAGQFIAGKIDDIKQIKKTGWYLCNANCDGAPTSFEGLVVNYMNVDGVSLKIWYSTTQEKMYIKQELMGEVKQEWTQIITKVDVDNVKDDITQAVNLKQNKTDLSLVTDSKTIAGAINELSTQKQDSTDRRLETSAKEIYVAINELNSGKSPLLHNHDNMYTRTEQLAQMLSLKENAFEKGTAFNKNFGTSEGTVLEGSQFEVLNDMILNIPEEIAPMLESKLDKMGGTINRLTVDGRFVTKNNMGVQCKDSTGTPQSMIYMDSANTIKVGSGTHPLILDSDNVTLKGGKTLWDNQNFNPLSKQDVTDSHFETENKTVVGSVNEVLTLTKKVSSDLSTKAPLVHNHDDSYMPRQDLEETINTLSVAIREKEPLIIEKGTAFNKDFGTSAGTVLEGTHLTTINRKIEEKQNKTDSSLQTQSKEIVGAINEIKKNTISSTGGNIDGSIQSKEYNGRGNYNIVTPAGTGGVTVHGTFSGRARSSTGVGEILVYNKTASSGIRFKDDGNVTIEGKTLTAQAGNLQTSAKDVVGAINELKTKKLELTGGTLVGHADMLKLDTVKASDSSYIKFLNGGVEKGWIGKGSSATDSIAIHNSTSNKGMTFRHDGALQLDATNLRTKNKEVVGAINELVTTKLSTDGSTKMTGSLSFGYGNPTTPNIKFLDSVGGIHGSLNSRGRGIDEDIYLENNVSGNGIYFKDNGEVRISAKKNMWIAAPNLTTRQQEVVGAINEVNGKANQAVNSLNEKVDKINPSLKTNSKEVIGAINELKESPSGERLPIGTVVPFVSDVIPLGYLMCDGREVVEHDYPELYKMLPLGKNLEREINEMAENEMPIMASSTQDGFTITSSTVYSGSWPNWKPFSSNARNEEDRSDSAWITQNGVKNGWIQVEYPQPVIVHSFKVTSRNSTSGEKINHLKLVGIQSDGFEEVVLFDEIFAPSFRQNEERFFKLPYNLKEYKTLKLYAWVDSSSSYVGIKSIQYNTVNPSKIPNYELSKQKKFLPDLKNEFLRGNADDRELLSWQPQDFNTFSTKTYTSTNPFSHNTYISTPKDGTPSTWRGTAGTDGAWDSMRFKWELTDNRPHNVSVNYMIKAKNIDMIMPSEEAIQELDRKFNNHKYEVEEIMNSSWNSYNTTIRKGENGYCKLANGLIIQWGVTSHYENGWVYVSLPLSFSSDHYSIGATALNPGSSAGTPALQVKHSTKSSGFFEFFIPGGYSTWSMSWVAIGY